MRLILTEYINSLKEDGELDTLLQDILESYQVKVFSKPEKGRQNGVDIYAVGKDFEDDNKKKVFLITVKRGDLDRRIWNGDQNSVQQSLDEIRTVFVRNNLAPQHKNLPIKIVVAFNGMLKQSVQQNWRGYAESYSDYTYSLWEIGFFVDNFQNRLLNEQAFSNDVRSLIRKSIIHLENPDYNLSDYSNLLDIIFEQFGKSRSKRHKLKLLNEIHLIVAIIVKYCKEAENLKHAINCTEKYVLKLWPIININIDESKYIGAFFNAYNLYIQTHLGYYNKLGYIAHIKDGYGRNANDSLTYTYIVYEQLGLICSGGLAVLQMYEILSAANNIEETAVVHLKNKALEITNSALSLMENNDIIYSPRADEHHIELSLLFILLFKTERKKELENILNLLSTQMAEGVLFSNIFPEFSNSKRIIAELDVDYQKRLKHKYKSNNLLTILIEWSVICQSKQLYENYVTFKKELLPEMNLLLWFPEKNTENILFKEYATHGSGYTLSGITLPSEMDNFISQIKEEFRYNCHEKEFSFMKQGIWSLGLIASRHYRTYIFPYYWRQYLY